MQRSPRSSSEWAAYAPAAMLVVGALLGLVAEWWAGGLAHPGSWVPDYLTGVGVLAAGAASIRLNRETAGLLVSTAVVWWLGAIAPGALYLHRIPLFHVVAVYPAWRPSSRAAGLLLAVIYLAIAVPAISGSDVGTAAYGLALIGVAGLRYTRSRPSNHRFRRAALLASVALFMGATGGAALRLVLSDSPRTATPTLLFYETMIVVASFVLWAGLRRPSVASLADLVVELDEASAATLRDELRRLLGDPHLEILFRTDNERYVTAQGVPVTLTDLASDRVLTPIVRDGLSEMAIVHDRSALHTDDLLAAVEAATRLSRANATLLAEARDRLDSLSMSRQRLVLAEDEERRRLADDLRRGVEARLESVEHKLMAGAERAADDRTRVATRQALEQLRLSREDLRAIAEGLHPGALIGGLDQALRSLTERLELPIELTLPPEELPPAAKTAVYYLSAEALNNIVKHARASSATVTVAIEDGRVLLVVTDDGVGGADPASGSGLSGLAERVSAVGGQLEITSPTGAGTRLIAEFPLDHQS